MAAPRLTAYLGHTRFRSRPGMNKPIPAVDHYDNGNLRFRGANLDGKMHGPWEFFRRDGSRMRSGSFEGGKQIGVWRTFDRTGKVLKETKFPAGASVKGRRTSINKGRP